MGALKNFNKWDLSQRARVMSPAASQNPITALDRPLSAQWPTAALGWPDAAVRSREIWILVLPGVDLRQVADLAQVFTAAVDLTRAGAAQEPIYDLRLLSATGGPLPTSSGLLLQTEQAGDRPLGDGVTVIVAGGKGYESAMHDPRLQTWVIDAAVHAQRVAAVCAGAFLLGAAGLLHGRRTVPPAIDRDHFISCFPDTIAEPNVTWLEDRGTWTAAGPMGAKHLATAIVERDLGHALALAALRALALDGYAHRVAAGPRGYAPHPAPSSSRLTPVLDSIRQNPGLPAEGPALADRAGMSLRSLYRAFQEELGMTPGSFVEQARLEAAMHLLDNGHDRIKRVAQRSGFGRAERMCAAFNRHLGVTPATYRSRRARSIR